MNEQVPVPPPPPATAGSCCGMGCATLLALIALFAIAFVGGCLWAVHHYKHEYTSAQPMTMPEDVTSEEPTAVEADSTSTSTMSATPIPTRHLETEWKAF